MFPLCYRREVTRIIDTCEALVRGYEIVEKVWMIPTETARTSKVRAIYFEIL